MLEFPLIGKKKTAGDGTSTKRIFSAPIKPRPMLTTAYSPLPGQAAGPLVSWLPQEKGCNLHHFKPSAKTFSGAFLQGGRRMILLIAGW